MGDEAKSAVAALSGVELLGGTPLPEVVAAAEVLRAVLVPAVASDFACVDADVELSAVVIRKLDSLLGVSGDVTNALLDRTSESRESQLDLQVLRKVFTFACKTGDHKKRTRFDLLFCGIRASLCFLLRCWERARGRLRPGMLRGSAFWLGC